MNLCVLLVVGLFGALGQEDWCGSDSEKMTKRELAIVYQIPLLYHGRSIDTCTLNASARNYRTCYRQKRTRCSLSSSGCHLYTTDLKRPAIIDVAGGERGVQQRHATQIPSPFMIRRRYGGYEASVLTLQYTSQKLGEDLPSVS